LKYSKLLREVYKHKSQWGEGFEFVCIERWFILYEFMITHKIDKCVILDSDILIFSNLTAVKEAFPDHDMTWTGFSAHINFINDISALKQFCDFFLGCLNAVQDLNEMGVANTSYLPVSISKRYKRSEIPEKDIDLIVYGRNHHALLRWVEQLALKTHLTVVRCRHEANGNYIAYSNKTGFIGRIDKRQELMDLLARSRYTVVSSPGNDPENKADMLRTGGYSPVTPRFLEAAVNYSVGIGIFPDNQDYRYCKVRDVSICVESYEQFEDMVCRTPSFENKSEFDRFLDDHWTEQRLLEIQKVIARL
jgi:hypothetical protein